MLNPLNVKYFKYAVGSNIGKETLNDISSKCIICGDSDTNDRMKRLHLYKKKKYEHDAIHCFNCNWTGNIYKFLKEVDSSLYEQYRREKRESSFDNMKKKRNIQEEFSDAVVLMGKPKAKKAKLTVYKNDKTGTLLKKPKLVFEFPKEFIKAENNEIAKKYLEGRRIDTDDIYFSENWLRFNGKNMPLKNSIIIPLWFNKKERLVYGFQARSTESKFFYTYIPEENTGHKVWNYYGIDPQKRVFVFESVFDALSSGLPKDQIIGALGADLNEDRMKELKEVIFCLDNQFKDITSKEKSIKLLKDGYRVFVWDKTIQGKDANKWLTSHPSKSVKDFAKIILLNIYQGNKGILKIKLKR